MPRRLREASPAYLFFGAFGASEDALDATRDLVVKRYGALHPRGESPVFPFPDTKTYSPTMGTDLVRRFWVLEKLWPQDGLAPVKRAAVDMEEQIRQAFPDGVARPVNIDPGIINDCRVILATTKDYAHRIYRGNGVWEEITLVYRHGAYDKMPWTYRDFLNPEYHRFFEIFREELIGRRGESG